MKEPLIDFYRILWYNFNRKKLKKLFQKEKRKRDINMTVIKVTQDWVNRIEALQYEVSARQGILAYMIENGHNMDSDNYKRYNAEYLDFFKQLEEAKEEFAEQYVYPETNGKRVAWNFDFKNLEVSF